MRKTLKDFEEVYTFFTRPDRIGDITDDYSPDMFTVVKKLLSQDIVYMPTPDTCFVASPINSIVYDVHLNTTEPDKKNVYENTLKSTQWVKDNTPVKVFMSFIPEIYGATLYYAQKIGMKKTGVVEGGFLKNGKQIDNVIMSAPVDKILEVLWRQQR